MSWIQSMWSGAQAVDKAADSFINNSAVGMATEAIKAVHAPTGNLAAAMIDIALGNPADDQLDNPFFEQNGHDGDSPSSTHYLKTVKYARMGMGVATSVADIGGVVSFGSSAGYYFMWLKLNALFETMVPESRRAKPAVYSGWIFREMTQKAVGAGSLELMVGAIIKQKLLNTAGNAAKGGLTLATGGFSGVFINAGAQTLGPYLEYFMGQDIAQLSQCLHWMAFRELTVGRGAKGPGLRILDVLWSEVTIGRPALPTIHVAVKEPRGWLVIADLMA